MILAGGRASFAPPLTLPSVADYKNLVPPDSKPRRRPLADVNRLLRGHELLPQDIRDKLPPLYSQDALGLEAQAIVKFFTPRSNWTWYASEGSPVDEDSYMDTDKVKVDYIMFGLVSGFAVELGYFSLSELETVKDPTGMPAVERDLYFQPDTLGNLMATHSG